MIRVFALVPILLASVAMAADGDDAEIVRGPRQTLEEIERIWAEMPPLDWLKRDAIHANDRGEQVPGHILARYFLPTISPKD